MQNQQAFYEHAKVIRPVKAGLNPDWEIWKQFDETDPKGRPSKVPRRVATVPPDRLPPHVRKALQYETRAYFHYGHDVDKHVFGRQVFNHRW